MPRRGYAQDAIVQANESRGADLIINGSNVTGNASQKGVGGGILTGGESPVIHGSKVSGNVSPDGVQIGQNWNDVFTQRRID